MNWSNLDHLLHALEQHYTISTDMKGSYIGLNIEWDYNNGTVDISMPGYIERALLRFQHNKPTTAQHSPHRSASVTYGKQQQLIPAPDTTPVLDAADNKSIQEIIGTLLYYARAVDLTLLVTLSTLAMQQSNKTNNERHYTFVNLLHHTSTCYYLDLSFPILLHCIGF
jgi:hypothetical protein